MKKTKLNNAKIISILKEGEAGVPVEDLCRRYGIAKSTYYKLKAKYGGMELSDLEKLKSLEEENNRLKRMYAELSLDHELLKDVIEKKLGGRLSGEY